MASQAIKGTLFRRQTDPAWLQDYFLKTGHSVDTRNATMTFVKRKDALYAVTCKHVVEALGDPAMVPDSRFPTIALQAPPVVLNFSRHDAGGVVTCFKIPKEPSNPDIAISKLSAGFWDILQSRKDKTAIDLDSWQEPRWNDIRFCVAAGYPDEHKNKTQEDILATPFTRVVAEVGGPMSSSSQHFELTSVLENPHGYFFSGMSGGPIFGVEGDRSEAEDEELKFIGITFEGYPASGKVNPAAQTGFLTDKDLFIRGLVVSPTRFDRWLMLCGF